MRAYCTLSRPPCIHPLTCQLPPELQSLDTASGAFSSWERCAPVDRRCCKYFMMGGETDAGCCGHSEWLWLLLLLLQNLENGFRGWGRRRFVCVSHLPELTHLFYSWSFWVRCVVSNQNLFEFHPCLAHEARSPCGFSGKSVTSRAVLKVMRAGVMKERTELKRRTDEKSSGMREEAE